MGQVLHGSATTTHAIRAAIQRSKAPLKELAAARDRWRQGRQATLQALPAWLLPHRHRRGPHRGGQAAPVRSRRPDLEVRLRPAGEARHGHGRQGLPRRPGRGRPLQDPHRAHGQRHPVADLPKNREGPTAMWRGHPFDRACHEHDIEHRLTKAEPPLDQRSGRADEPDPQRATVRRYHSRHTHRQLEDHLAAFLDAYNFARRLKTLRGLTPYEAICKAWADEPERFSSTGPLDLGTEHLETAPPRLRRGPALSQVIMVQGEAIAPWP